MSAGLIAWVMVGVLVLGFSGATLISATQSTASAQSNTALYVSATGSYTSNCQSQASPCASISHAVSEAGTLSGGSVKIAYPGDQAKAPVISDLNWPAGATIANLTLTELGAQSLNIYNNSGSTNAIADVEGWCSP